MALKMNTVKKERPKLPEGGDRFLWTELPVMKAPVKKQCNYGKILKFDKRAEL